MNAFTFRISSFPFVTVRRAEHSCLVSFSWGPDSPPAEDSSRQHLMSPDLNVTPSGAPGVEI